MKTDDNRSQYTKLIQKWDYNYPELIYHYTSTTIALEKILFDKRIRLSRFNSLNDPKESKPTFIIDDSKNINTSYREINLFYKYFISHTKLLCFSISERSKDNDSKGKVLNKKGFTYQRMWAQYGSNHTGVCLAFDRKELVSKINSLNEGKVIYKKVLYKNIEADDEKLGKIDSYELKELGYQKYFKKFALENEKQYIFTKYLEWKKEREYRIVLLSDSDDDTYINIENALVAIVIGSEFPKVYLPSIISISKELNVDLFQIEWKNGFADNLSAIDDN